MTLKTDPAVDEAMHGAAGGGLSRYDDLAVALHWATVVLVLLQFALAELWGFFPRPTRHLMVVGHMSFGIVLAAVVAARIVWRLVPGHAVAPAVSGLTSLAAKGVELLLYVLLVAQAVLGFVLRWAGDESMSFFGLQLAPPFAPWSKPAQDLMGELHEWTGWAIIAIAAGHAAAALYHHYVVRDRVLVRMLPGNRG